MNNNFNALVLGLKLMENNGKLGVVANISNIDINRIKQFMKDESELTKLEQDKLWELHQKGVNKNA